MGIVDELAAESRGGVVLAELGRALGIDIAKCAGRIVAKSRRRKSMTARLQRSAPKEPKIAECRSRDPSLDRGFGVVPGEFDEPGDGSERRSGTRSIDMSCRQELGHEKGKIGDGIRQRIDRYASIRDADILRRGAA